jgi:hypothetical protein
VRHRIHQRPTKAHLRSQFGHWEGDLMHFRRQRDILLTLQERRSRLTLARRLLGKDAELAAEAIAAELGGLPARARRTIPTTTAASSRATRRSLRPSVSTPTSATRTAHGSAAPSRTPTAGSVAIYPGRPNSETTAMPTSTT